MAETFSFGNWIRQRRRALDLTQDELAERVGCSISAIRKIEADERRPSRQVADLLANALQIPDIDRPTFLKVARMELGFDRLSTITAPAVQSPVISPVVRNGAGGDTAAHADLSGGTRTILCVSRRDCPAPDNLTPPPPRNYAPGIRGICHDHLH